MTSFSLIQAQKLTAIKYNSNQSSNIGFPQQSQQTNSIFDKKPATQLDNLSPSIYQPLVKQQTPFNFSGSNQLQNLSQQNPFDLNGLNNQQTQGNFDLKQILSSLMQMIGGKQDNSTQAAASTAPTASTAPVASTAPTTKTAPTEKTAPAAKDNRESAPNAIKSGKDHFEKFGKKEGRTFTSEEQYLKDYPDVKAAIERGKAPAADPNNINEESYLAANPDVAKAVKEGTMPSGKEHYKMFGANEGRYTSKEEAAEYLKKATETPATQPATASEPAKTADNKTTAPGKNNTIAEAELSAKLKVRTTLMA